MKTLQVDAHNHLVLSSTQSLNFIEGKQGLVQRINQALKTFLGHNFVAPNKGLHFKQLITNKTLSKAQVLDALASIPEVQDVLSITNIIQGDILRFIVTLKTTEGDLKVSL